jgi:very-short-patch-repair endonuclease
MAAVAANGGVIHRDQALSLVPDHVVKDAVRGGALVRLFPRVYASSDAAPHPEVQRHAALLCVPDAALSHLDALAHWELPGERRRDAPPGIHLSRSAALPPIEIDGLLVHRRRTFAPHAPHAVVRLGARVVRMEQAIIESWPLLQDVDQRLPAIVAVRDRRTRGRRLLEFLERQPKTAGAGEMRELFDLLAFGIHSHLEAWGHAKLFTDRRLPFSRAQVKVTLPSGRHVYLDRLFEEEMVNVELDGAAYHGKPGQRERDIRRDAALAALGYVTVRFSHLRLHADPEGCLNELLAILATRRRQLQPA